MVSGVVVTCEDLHSRFGKQLGDDVGEKESLFRPDEDPPKMRQDRQLALIL